MQLNLSLKELTDVIGSGAYTAPADQTFSRITSINTATNQDIAFVFDRGEASVFDAVDLETIKKSNAGLIVATKNLVDEKNFLLVDDPLQAFQTLVAHLEKQREAAVKNKPTSIDETAHIAPSALVKPGSSVGKQAVIMDQAFIGHNCFIGNNVTIYPGAKVLDGTIIGDGTIIHAGAVTGSDGFGYQVTKQGLRKIPQIGIVRIGKQVEIGANATIDRAAFNETIVEDFVKIDNSVHLSHNVRVGAGSAILAQTIVAGSVSIGRGCQIGGHVAIRDNISIGDGVKIVSKSAIMNSVKPGEVIAGIPAVSFTQWKRTIVLLTKLPELFKQAQHLKATLDRKRRSLWQRIFGK